MAENLFKQPLAISHGQRQEAYKNLEWILWIYQWFDLHFFFYIILLLMPTTNKLIHSKFFLNITLLGY